jgi:hypothetical protein
MFGGGDASMLNGRRVLARDLQMNKGIDRVSIFSCACFTVSKAAALPYLYEPAPRVPHSRSECFGVMLRTPKPFILSSEVRTSVEGWRTYLLNLGSLYMLFLS